MFYLSTHLPRRVRALYFLKPTSFRSPSSKLRYCAVALLGILFFLAATVLCGVFVAPLPETDALFHEEFKNALKINLEDVGYVGGQLIVFYS